MKNALLLFWCLFAFNAKADVTDVIDFVKNSEKVQMTMTQMKKENQEREFFLDQAQSIDLINFIYKNGEEFQFQHYLIKIPYQEIRGDWKNLHDFILVYVNEEKNEWTTYKKKIEIKKIYRSSNDLL